MKGILKIYHPEETLKYFIKRSYCKAAYANDIHLLDVEIVSDDSLDHVDDDSLQYNFPQISLMLSDLEIPDGDICGKEFALTLQQDEEHTEVDLYDDEDAFLSENVLSFSEDEEGEPQLIWKGYITDFYTASDEPIAFKLKCHFKQEEIEIEHE